MIPLLPRENAIPTIVLIFILCMSATHQGVETLVRVWMALLSMAGLLWPSLPRRSAFWLVMSIVLATNLITLYARCANHYYLTIYTSLYLTIEAWRRERGSTTSINLPRALLILTFGFATLQKVLSDYFLSGRLLAGYVLNGDAIYRILSRVYPSHPDAVQAFFEASGDVAGDVALGTASLPLTLPGDGFSELCRILALGIVGFELLMFAALAFRRVFDHPIMPALMLAFVWGTFTFRNEFAFFALLCILFLASRPRTSPIFQRLLVLSTGVFLAYDVSSVVVLL